MDGEDDDDSDDNEEDRVEGRGAARERRRALNLETATKQWLTDQDLPSDAMTTEDMYVQVAVRWEQQEIHSRLELWRQLQHEPEWFHGIAQGLVLEGSWRVSSVL